jgi:hypothetical protein
MEAHYVHKRVSRTYGVAALCNVHEPWALSDTNSELTCPNCLKALVASETRGATMIVHLSVLLESGPWVGSQGAACSPDVAGLSLSDDPSKVTCKVCRAMLVSDPDLPRIHVPGKPVLTGLFRDQPDTPEGKYLVKRRDGTVVEWPSFVLGARDPYAEIALRSYASAVLCDIEKLGDEEARRLGLTREWVESLTRFADTFAEYRAEHGHGDPGKGRHRKDDPATIAEMRKGWSA